jgi:hypothetical protein
MMEFNADGSLKLPGGYAKQMKRINIRKDIISEFAPKKCMLSITGEKNRVSQVLSIFSCDTPIKKIESEKGFDVEIGSDFKRCSDCKSLSYKLSACVNGDCNIDNGTCTAKGFQQRFCDEDYFEY